MSIPPSPGMLPQATTCGSADYCTEVAPRAARPACRNREDSNVVGTIVAWNGRHSHHLATHSDFREGASDWEDRSRDRTPEGMTPVPSSTIPL